LQPDRREYGTRFEPHPRCALRRHRAPHPGGARLRRPRACRRLPPGRARARRPVRRLRFGPAWAPAAVERGLVDYRDRIRNSAVDPMTEMLGAAGAPVGVAGPGPFAGRQRWRVARVAGASVDREAWPMRAFLALADVLARYHRHRVVNL